MYESKLGSRDGLWQSWLGILLIHCLECCQHGGEITSRPPLFHADMIYLTVHLHEHVHW